MTLRISAWSQRAKMRVSDERPRIQKAPSGNCTGGRAGGTRRSGARARARAPGKEATSTKKASRQVEAIHAKAGASAHEAKSVAPTTTRNRIRPVASQLTALPLTGKQRHTFQRRSGPQTETSSATTDNGDSRRHHDNGDSRRDHDRGHGRADNGHAPNTHETRADSNRLLARRSRSRRTALTLELTIALAS